MLAEPHNSYLDHDSNEKKNMKTHFACLANIFLASRYLAAFSRLKGKSWVKKEIQLWKSKKSSEGDVEFNFIALF